tara:strand:- start:4 stop:405 length:402 start_codon:yes stop_codon:yes gene_type:complete
MIFDIWQNTSNDRDQVSRLEAKDLDQCVKMVLDYYVKPEFHSSVEEEWIDENLTYITIVDNTEIQDSEDCEDYEVESLTFEIHVSEDQEDKSFKVISGHDEFITLDQNGKTKTPFSQGKLLDQVREIEKLNKN